MSVLDSSTLPVVLDAVGVAVRTRSGGSPTVGEVVFTKFIDCRWEVVCVGGE